MMKIEITGAGEAPDIVVNGVPYILYVDQPTEPTAPQFNAAAFFDAVRKDLFGGRLNQGQVDGMNLIGTTCAEADLDPLVEQMAYVLATVYHETGQTMQPIEEWGKGKGKSYYPWYGRGHVQLTWEENYAKQQNKHGHKGEDWCVHDDKDRALIPDTSATICVYGMKDGDFTSKKLNDYIREGSVDYVNARRIVNGTDRADMIAGYAEKFASAIHQSLGDS